MSVPLFVAERYLRTGSAKGYASVVSMISFLGLVIGVVALIVVVSVMNGFDRELKARILGVVPHVTVTGSSEASLEGIREEYGVAAITPFQEKQALLISARGSHLVSVYGIEPGREQGASALPGSIVEGSLDELAHTQKGILLGQSAARRLGLSTGDRVSLLLPKINRGGSLLQPKLVSMRLVGTFVLGSEVDYRLGVVRLEDLVSVSGEAPGLRITLFDIFAAPVLAGELKARGLEAQDWTYRYGDFFETVRMEKIMMFFLLSFVIAVASFSIVAGLSMLVDAKRRDIAVLRTLGLTEAAVLRLFLAQGAMITCLGVVVGVVLGVPLAWYAPEMMGAIESLFGFSTVEGTYFDRIPTDPRFVDIVAIVAVAMVIGLAATLYPCIRASRLPPAEILRYE